MPIGDRASQLEFQCKTGGPDPHRPATKLAGRINALDKQRISCSGEGNGPPARALAAALSVSVPSPYGA
jgi:hypothetical protein